MDQWAVFRIKRCRLKFWSGHCFVFLDRHLTHSASPHPEVFPGIQMRICCRYTVEKRPNETLSNNSSIIRHRTQENKIQLIAS